MKIVDPQTATLTNLEVVSYFTANPPRKSAEAPPGVRNFIPKPDLRDHCTVVTEIHNYVERTSPHLLNYPRFTHDSSTNPTTHTLQQPSTDQVEPYIQPAEPTPADEALRKVVQELAPYNLTKGEVMMLINLGVGVKQKKATDVNAMDVEEAAENGEGEGAEEDDMYGHQALLSTIVEEMEERLSEEDIMNIFRIMNENLGSGQ
ncbi:hypothetical protein TMatcc_004644 [Talaromyces marneffei ATCC 18224]|uniref:DNA-directed RNA polymerase III subunit RPC9 n=2 Tax=Talaromyces marneffei TaxID=37727 RepID=B6Q3H2_TALMQ|nr:uncharacterized protein EYB26_000426 [Talaromyces marneffei]EEA27078.1 conserved hypothetical protein [Talaromyces marneffei ATCC 18224]KAE8557201.1 hypothetical protein EYB25_001907 [Talaromyces marneffei]QGA12781.1 hypothetical protein EYB26_000426 [Talaromyces marneffei]